MSAQTATAFDAQRLRRLDAMGVRVWRLRASARAEAAGEPVDAAGGVRLVVVSDEPRTPAVDAIVRTLGIADEAIGWCVAQGGKLASLDLAAGAYLVLGAHLARVVGAELPTAAQQRAAIVVAAAPSALRGDAMAKRLLWQALKPLKRRLAVR
jgi:DNA polymerase III psi subunit